MSSNLVLKSREPQPQVLHSKLLSLRRDWSGVGTMSCSRSKAVLPLVNDRSLRSDSQASPRQFSRYLVDLANLIQKERDRTQT